MTDEINRDRRRFLGTAAMAITAAPQLGMMRSTGAQSSTRAATTVSATRLGTITSFGTLKQIDAGVLNIGYTGSQSRRYCARWFFSTDGPTTFTPTSMLPRCWHRRATG